MSFNMVSSVNDPCVAPLEVFGSAVAFEVAGADVRLLLVFEELDCIFTVSGNNLRRQIAEHD